SADGSTSVNSIDFSSLISATDNDGDTVSGLSADSFVITVQDDIPIVNSGATPISAQVEEDDLPTGNNEDASSNADIASGSSGALSSLFTTGADTPLTISMSSDTSGLPTLYSQGEALVYDVTNNVLTATAHGDTIFTLSINSDGAWSFDLDGQLDHVDDGNNDENTALITSADGSTSVNSIDFSSLISATDNDGDTVSGLSADSFVITVQDDIPIVNSGATPIS